MAYITNTDIELFLGTPTYVQLTDDAGSGSADVNKVNQALLGAEGEVNSYLAARYRVPLDLAGESELQNVLRTFVLDLVSYRLHSRRPPVPGDVVRRRSEAVEWLARVAAGLVQLPATIARAEPTSLGVIADVRTNPRSMTRDELKDL